VKAAVYTEYGPPDVVHVGEVEKPVPKDNEILVRIRATTICAADWRLRKADPFLVRLMNGLLKPKINVLGAEFAGAIESVGKNVTRFRAGDDVFGSPGFKFGAHAEYICVPEDGAVAMKPSTLTHEEAAAVFFGAISALHFLRRANVQTGQKVLIYGASGSVGIFAVQLAKHFGAHVTGVCSTANLEMVKSLGADEVVDYTRDDFSRAGRVYDVIVDTVGKSGFARSMKSLKRGGSYVLVAGPIVAATLGAMWASLTGSAKITSGVAKRVDGDLAFLTGLIENGKLRTVIDRRYPLEQIAEAHRFAEAGHKKGHVVVLVDPASNMSSSGR
jgi:2-desacetyl-2-hydroxyethyl bacteriochlorophyllide A dehydrogenase